MSKSEDDEISPLLKELKNYDYESLVRNGAVRNGRSLETIDPLAYVSVEVGVFPVNPKSGVPIDDFRMNILKQRAVDKLWEVGRLYSANAVHISKYIAKGAPNKFEGQDIMSACYVTAAFYKLEGLGEKLG